MLFLHVRLLHGFSWSSVASRSHRDVLEARETEMR